MPFIGSEALRDGVVANKHQLRKRFRALYPDVYLPDGRDADTGAADRGGMAVDAQAGCDRGFGGLCDARSAMDPRRRS